MSRRRSALAQLKVANPEHAHTMEISHRRLGGHFALVQLQRPGLAATVIPRLQVGSGE